MVSLNQASKYYNDPVPKRTLGNIPFFMFQPCVLLLFSYLVNWSTCQMVFLIMVKNETKGAFPPLPYILK